MDGFIGEGGRNAWKRINLGRLTSPHYPLHDSIPSYVRETGSQSWGHPTPSHPDRSKPEPEIKFRPRTNSKWTWNELGINLGWKTQRLPIRWVPHWFCFFLRLIPALPTFFLRGALLYTAWPFDGRCCTLANRFTNARLPRSISLQRLLSNVLLTRNDVPGFSFLFIRRWDT